jgi:DNA-directed RNA polymerase subunit H (RpoH/RPB5)
MHIFQQKFSKLKENEINDFLKKCNISLSQLPKIKLQDPGLSEDIKVGDVIKIERKGEEAPYYRVVVM